MNPRLTPEPIAHGVALIIDTYCDWINQFDDEPEWHIHPPIFFEPPYGFVELDLDPYHTYDYTVWSLTVDYGDEGGPQGLTAWWGPAYINGSDLLTGEALRAALTRLLPSKTTQDWWIDTFTKLEHMTQTFDTMFAVVMTEGKINTQETAT